MSVKAAVSFNLCGVKFSPFDIYKKLSHTGGCIKKKIQ